MGESLHVKGWVQETGIIGGILEAGTTYLVQILRIEPWTEHVSQYLRSHFSTSFSIPGAICMEHLITGVFITLRE